MMSKPKSEPALTDPHDTLVRWTFSQRKHAAGLLKAALSPAFTRACDWRTLRLEKGSFVSKQLRKRHSDLVFSVVAAGQPLFVYVLLEHQRNVAPLMAFRMLVYMTRLWEQFVRDHPGAKTLPAVLPILLHHSATGWTAATAFEELIAADGAVRAALERHIPHFEMRLIDLSPGRASALVNAALTALGDVVLRFLSVAGDDELLEQELERLGSVLDKVLASPDGPAAFEVLMRYIGATHQNLSAANIGELFEKSMGPQGQEAIVTFIDEIEAKGKLEGKREALLDLLAARFGRVPARLQARIRAADEAAVGRWTVLVLTAKTAAAVIGDDAEATGGARAVSTKRTGVAHRRAAVASKRA
jgi:predicted transposase/invertase (TIGR01784 family)